MAFLRNCIATALLAICIISTNAQTVFYPNGASPLLMATASDAAMLLQKAIPGSNFTTQAYTNIPTQGIVLIYDSTIQNNQNCVVTGNGTNLLKFSAFEDNGLHFGIYQYLRQKGFRFYQTGEIWEITPTLASPFSSIDTIYSCAYKYKTWFVSGGYSKWAMDNSSTYTWFDTYAGQNGNALSLYQRRNGMLGESSFSGHRGDIMTGNYLATIKNNPCYVANYNGSRVANSQSTPDIFSTPAKDLWVNTIEQKFTSSKSIIFNNPVLYVQQFRRFNYYGNNIGIEVPDGAQWGNASQNDICNATNYPSESDQNMILANYTAQKITSKFSNKHVQMYAYNTHANVPSATIEINKSIDVQLIPGVYQLESSNNGLRNRWYKRHSNLSEYHYLNLSGWSGETPNFNWSELKATLQIAKENKSQGLMWEASPAKFGSLPYLLAANNFLTNNIDVDSTLNEFCKIMFGEASNTVLEILQKWGQENTIPNRYKLQIYLQLLSKAAQQVQNEPAVVHARIRELKAYLHYMVLHFNLNANDQNKLISKEARDEALCIYIAKTNKLQLVNSYYLIFTIASKYAKTSNFYAKYNVVNGSVYANGTLPLITDAEIDNNFLEDLNKFGGVINKYQFEDANQIKSKFKTANLTSKEIIKTKIGYTNGINYYGKAAFNIVAPAAGSFTINYTPRFDQQLKGYINFAVESADKALLVVKDYTIENPSGAGSIKVNLPEAGNYIFTITTKFQAALNLEIITNGNYFYKSGPFLGAKTESYSDDIKSLPGYFYIPPGLTKIYCSAVNYEGGKYVQADLLSQSFGFKDNNNNTVILKSASASDSTLFYLEIPSTAWGTFWQATKMAQYNLQFVNISNMLWFAQPSICTATPTFKATINKIHSVCTTQLSTNDNAAGLQWEVTDNGKILNFNNLSQINLPENISPNAMVTLTNAQGCSFSKKLNADAKYVSDLQLCTSGASVATNTSPIVMYPNPSTGIFNCTQKGNESIVNQIVVYNLQGTVVAKFNNTKQFNISNAAAGTYLYQAEVNGQVFKGKILKL